MVFVNNNKADQLFEKKKKKQEWQLMSDYSF